MILLTHINEIAGLPNEPFFIPLTYSTSNGLLSDIQYISLVKRGANRAPLKIIKAEIPDESQVKRYSKRSLHQGHRSGTCHSLHRS